MQMHNVITISIVFPKNLSDPLNNMTHYIEKFKDHIDVIDFSYEQEWTDDKSCVKLYGKERGIK